MNKKGLKSIKWVTSSDEESSSLPKPSQSLIAPSTQRSENRNLEYREGDILGQYEIGEKLAHTENGGQGTVYRARRKEDGLDVVLKIYSAAEKPGDWDEILHEEKRAGREIRFLERANKDGIRGLPTLVQYGTTGSFIKTPVAVFEPLPGRTLEQEVLDPNYTPVFEKALAIMKGLSEPLQYAHESNGVKPVVHRDINPGNIMINGEPILMDWATSTNPSTGRTLLRTQMYTQHFTAPEVTEGKDFDSRADIYSLGKVGQFILLGKSFIETEGQPTKKDFENMNIPAKIIAVLERATNENPAQRYRTVRDFYNELGISLQGNLSERAGEKKLGVAKVVDNSNGIKITEYDLRNGFGTIGLHIGDQVSVLKRDNVNKALERIRFQDANHNELTLAYLQYAAKKHPVLQDVIDGKKSLEGILREKKPKHSDFIKGDANDALIFESTLYDKDSFEKAKQQYNQRRAELLDVFGMQKRDFEFGNNSHAGINGAIGGSIGGFLSSYALQILHSGFLPFGSASEFFPWILGHTVLGVIAGPRINIYVKKRKLLKEAREMDSWIREARVSQGLERKVEPERHVELRVEDPHNNLNKVLIQLGLEKKFLKRKFVGDNIEVYYKKNYYGKVDTYGDTTLKIIATSEEKVKPLLGALISSSLGIYQGEILIDGTKVPYSQYNVGLEKELPTADRVRSGGHMIQN